jgi:hypothetical protein
MLTATITLMLSKDMSVTKKNVTPAEAAYYIAEHQNNYGAFPIKEYSDEAEVERKPSEEIRRLYGKFPAKKIKALYPAIMANVPETFDEAREIGMQTTLPTDKLVNVDISNS